MFGRGRPVKDDSKRRHFKLKLSSNAQFECLILNYRYVQNPWYNILLELNVIFHFFELCKFVWIFWSLFWNLYDGSTILFCERLNVPFNLATKTFFTSWNICTIILINIYSILFHIFCAKIPVLWLVEWCESC